MKDRYFGDINDYRKYGLLRLLAGRAGLKTAVCWMRTPDDGSSGGVRTGYLRYPLLWSHYDPELFYCLQSIVIERKLRDVRALEQTGMLPDATFFSRYLPDNAVQRNRYFKSFMDEAQPGDLIFFDPDNGIEVRSMPRGRKGSSRYVYWREIIAAYTSGHTVLIYQHFPRITREGFIPSIAGRLVRETGAPLVCTFRTAHVLFLLACRDDHEDRIRQVLPEIEKKWEPQFMIAIHTP